MREYFFVCSPGGLLVVVRVAAGAAAKGATAASSSNLSSCDIEAKYKNIELEDVGDSLSLFLTELTMGFLQLFQLIKHDMSPSPLLYISDVSTHLLRPRTK